MTQNDVEKIAKRIKTNRLRQLPGMDEVAVVLNCNPTYEETQDMWMLIREIEACGYEIKEKVK